MPRAISGTSGHGSSISMVLNTARLARRDFLLVFYKWSRCRVYKLPKSANFYRQKEEQKTAVKYPVSRFRCATRLKDIQRSLSVAVAVYTCK